MGDIADQIVEQAQGFGLWERIDVLWDITRELEGPDGDHSYSPDYQAQGDCKHCGHTYEARTDNPRVTRALKHKAHLSFDRLWKTGKMTRSEAYQWLAIELGVPASEAHMAAMSRHAVLERVIVLSDIYMGISLAADDFPDDI